MANWNLPTITSQYIDFVTEMNDKIADSGTLSESPTNQPEKYIRYNRSINLFQEWLGGNWQNKVLSIAGGGTGSSTQSGIIANLGLGSMATQNSNAVNITGGSITGVNLDAGSITGGILPLSRGGTGSSLIIPPYGWIIVSNGAGQMVMDPGTAIAQIDASRIVQGIIPDARLSANIPRLNTNNSWTGNNTFNGVNQLNNSVIITSFGAGPDNFSIRSVYPLINFNATDSPVGLKNFRIIYNGGVLNFQVFNDDSTSAISAMQLHWNGYMIANGTFINPLNASNLSLGMVPIAVLGASGSRDTTTFLRGDNTWAVPPTGGGGTAIPAGLVAMFDGSCPAGWTRYSQMDGRFPIGANSVGGTGGGTNHSHSLSGGTDLQGGHTHSVDVAGNANGSVNGNTAGPDHTVQINYDAGTSTLTFARDHFHAFSAPVSMPISASGNTNNSGAHNHSLSGGTSVSDHMPPYYNIVFCRKD